MKDKLGQETPLAQARSQRGAGGEARAPHQKFEPSTKDSVITNFAGTDKSAISIIVLTVC